MPTTSGCEPAQRARDIRPELRVVFVSGYSPDERVQSFIDAGEADGS